MRARLALVLALALAGASLFVVFAGAAHKNHNDGNDTPGFMDVRKVKTFGPVKEPGWRVLTFARFGLTKMRDRGFVIVNLDTFGDARFDYYALVRSNGSHLDGSLWRDPESKRDRRIAKLTVWRASKDSVSLRIPLKKMRLGGKNTVTFRWFVQTLLSGDKCRRVCIDRVPNNGAVTERNGKPEPKPTPTKTPDEDPGLHQAPVDPDPTESPAATEAPTATESPAATESP